MPRVLSFLLPTLALLLLTLQPAPGKSLLGPENRIGGVESSLAIASWGESLSSPDNIREEPPEGYDIASDVRDGPNVYAYVRQNPWTAWDPEGLGSLSESQMADWRAMATGAKPGPDTTILEVGAQFIPGVSQVQSVMTLSDPKASAFEKTLAVVGMIPEMGGLFKGGKAVVNEIKALTKVEKTAESIAKDASILEHNAVDLELKFKSGWTKEQRAAAEAKAKALTECQDTKVIKNPERGGTAQSRYRKEAGLDAKTDADHTIDLQLNGKDVKENLSGLDSSVNRSLGPQIQKQIKPLPENTPINKVTISDK